MSIAKFGKKLGLFLVAVFMFFAIIGCENTNTPTAKDIAKEHNDDIYEKIFWDPSAMIDITVSTLRLVTTTSYEDTVVTWESSDENVITVEGVVNRPNADYESATLVDPTDPDNKDKHVEVTLTATITTTYESNKTISRKKSFKFTVLCLSEDMDFGTIAEVKAHAYQYIYEEQGVKKDLVSNSSVTYSVGFYAKVTAILNASGAGQFMVHDGTEGIYVYKSVEGLKVGDTVLVYGDIYSYYGSLQVGSNVTVSVVADRGIEVPAHTEISVQEWENSWEIGYLGGKLYSIYAKLEKEANTTTSDNYKLVDPFTGEVAWIYYKSYNAEQEATLASFAGKYVKITGVSYDRDSRMVKNHLLWDGGIKEVDAPTLTDEQKMANAKATVSAMAGEYPSGTAFEFEAALPDYDAQISWDIPENAPWKNGKFEIVSQTTKFTAKATITINGLVETVEVEITVKPVAEVSVSEAVKKEKDSVVKLSGTVEAVFASKGYFYLKDRTGTILVYVTTADGITVNGVPTTLKAGDQLTLTGTMNFYNGTPQIGSVISYDAHEAGEWTVSKPRETSFEELKSFTAENAPYGQYLMLRGKITPDGSYFLFGNGEITISLYNSNVPADLAAISGQDVEATLFFYYYGNSKADYTGVIRVIFCGREGEYFIGDQEVIIPEDGAKTEFPVKSFGQLNAMVPNNNDTTQEKYYVEGYVKSIVNTQYGNLYIETEDGSEEFYIYGVYSFDGKLRFDAMGADQPQVGQYVVLYGVVTNYNGTIEMKNAWLVQLENHVFSAGGQETPGPKEEFETEFPVKSIEELSAMVPNPDDTTKEKYYVAGYVQSITSATYGNMVIESFDGSQTLTIYGTYNFDGSSRFDAMNPQPKEGQFVVLYGVMTNYNGTIEMKNAWMVQLDDVVFEADPGTEPGEGQTKVTINVGEVAAANGWENAQPYYDLPTGDANFTITTTSAGNNNGKYYSSNSSWRIYKTDGGVVTIAAVAGIKIVSIKVSFTAGNGGEVTCGSANYVSGEVIEVGAQLVSFSVGQKAGTTGNPNIQITAIEVVYEAGSGSVDPTPDPIEPDPEPKEEFETEFPVESIEDLEALVPNAEDKTPEKHYVAGYIKSIENATWGNITIESADGKHTLIIYGSYNFDGSLRFDAMGEDQPKVGQFVVLYGVMYNYKGTKFEMENGWFVQIDDVVCGPKEVEPDPVDPDPVDPVEGQVTLDFVSSFADYAKSWDSSYTSRTVKASQLGVNNLDATIAFTRANKQSGTITDRPVIAANKSTEYVTVSVNDVTISKVTFNFAQWGTKKFNTFKLEYTTDGTTWVDGNAAGAWADATAAEAPLSLSLESLPEGVVAVRVAIGVTASSNTQVGLTSVVLDVKSK